MYAKKAVLLSVFLLSSSQAVFCMDAAPDVEQARVGLRQITEQEKVDLLLRETYMLSSLVRLHEANKNSFSFSFGPDYELVIFNAWEEQAAKQGVTEENYQNFKELQKFFGPAQCQQDFEKAAVGALGCCLTRALIPAPISPCEIPVDMGICLCGLTLFNKKCRHNEVEPVVCQVQSNPVPEAVVMGGKSE